MSKPILVTGASGNIGRVLVRLLLERGEPVKAATRHPGHYPTGLGVDVVDFDFDQPQTYAPALAGTDRLLLMPRGLDLEPCATAAPLLEQAKASGVRHVVLISGFGVERLVEYPGHFQLEKLVQSTGLEYTILRPTWFMTLLIRGLNLPRQRNRLCPPVGEARLSFIDTDDIAAAAAVCLTEPGHWGQIYAMTGDEIVNFDECAEIIAQNAGCQMRYEPATEDEMREIYARVGMMSPSIEYMMWYFAAVRAGWYEIVTPTVAELLGRRPTTLAQFAKKNAPAWKNAAV